MYYLREGTDHGHYFVRLEPESSNVPMTVTADPKQAKEFGTRSSVERFQRNHERLVHLEIVRDNTKIKHEIKRDHHVTVSKKELIYLRGALGNPRFHRVLDDLERSMRVERVIEKCKDYQ